MNDLDRSILTYSESGRAALAEIERLNARIARLIRAINANMEHDGTAGDPTKLVEILRGEIEGTDITDSIQAEWRERLSGMRAERDAEKARADATERKAIEALTKAGLALGVHSTMDLAAHVKRVCEDIDAITAERDAARAEVERLRAVLRLAWGAFAGPYIVGCPQDEALFAINAALSETP